MTTETPHLSDEQREELHQRAMDYRCTLPQHAEPAWRALIAYVESLLAAERQAIIAAIPGGNSVDPQWVCDMIRARG